MNQASLPPLSFFLEKVIKLDNLIPGLNAYVELLHERISTLDPYEDPLLFIKEADYLEKISSFAEILIDERKRTKNTENESPGNSGPDANPEGQVHQGTD